MKVLLLYPVQYPVRRQVQDLLPGAFGVTSLHLSCSGVDSGLGGAQQQEEQVRAAVRLLAEPAVAVKFINLRRLSIDSPLAAYDQELVADLMRLDLPFTELKLEMWTFHTPGELMWTRTRTPALKELDLHLNDGIAFPDATRDALQGLKECQRGLRTFRLTNASPHEPTIPRSLLPAASEHVSTNGVTLLSPLPVVEVTETETSDWLFGSWLLACFWLLTCSWLLACAWLLTQIMTSV